MCWNWWLTSRGKPIEETARELGLDPHDIVKLASNENPLGPSPKAVEAIARAAAGVNIYPDGAAFRLRSAIAEFCGVEFGQTVVGTGSSEVIELMCHALLNPRAEVVAARHAFSMYPIMSKLFGATYVEVPNKPDWTHDLNGFLDAITDNTRIVFITNPTNPVGTVVTQQEIDDFMAKVPEHVLVCFDEAYREFSDNPPDTLKFVREGRNVIVLRTFSKAYGLAGLRVGYGIAPEHVCSMLHKARAPVQPARAGAGGGPGRPGRPGARAPHRGEQCRGHAFLRTGFPGHGAGMDSQPGQFHPGEGGAGQEGVPGHAGQGRDRPRAGRLRAAGVDPHQHRHPRGKCPLH